MSDPALTPCPHCKQPARLCRDHTDTANPAFFVGCSNEVDCEVWPVTASKSTEAEAVAAWEAGETR